MALTESKPNNGLGVLPVFRGAVRVVAIGGGFKGSGVVEIIDDHGGQDDGAVSLSDLEIAFGVFSVLESSDDHGNSVQE